MRSIIILSCIFLSATQPPDTCYSNSNESYCFHDNHFTWHRSGDRKVTGNGTYLIKGDSIQLNFETAVREFDISVNQQPTTSEEVRVKINVMRSDGTPVRGLKVMLSKSDEAAETNSRGEVEFHISSPAGADELFVEFNGQRSPGLKLDLRGHNTFLGVVIDEGITYRENQSVTLPFKKKGRKVLIGGSNLKATRSHS